MVKKGRPRFETTDGSTYHLLLRNAKSNRRYPTEAEAVLWEHVCNSQLGVHFRRQHPIEGYIPDLVCIREKLIVEIDGGYHFIDNQSVSDAERTAYLEAQGYRVLRFTNEEVLHDIETVLKRIKKMVENNSELETNVQSESQDFDAKGISCRESVVEDLNPQGAPLLRRGGGRLIIVSAPSGSGKSTIVNWLMETHPELNLAFSISCTSRAPRGTEQNGVEYFFLTPEEFRQKIANDEFLEYEEVYEDRFYGTLKEQVVRQREAGQNVVFDVDVKGGCNIKEHYGDEALSLFIQPPSIEELRRRLVNRGTDSPEAIEDRLAKAAYELTFAERFDCVVVNDDLATAEADAYRIVSEFLSEEKNG